MRRLAPLVLLPFVLLAGCGPSMTTAIQNCERELAETYAEADGRTGPAQSDRSVATADCSAEREADPVTFLGTWG